MPRNAVWILLAVLSTLAPGPPADAAETPNFVIIFIDDMGYADIGPFGNTTYPTPNLDRMAREGRRFTNFMVSSPICSASRAALLTGCFHRRVSIVGAMGPKTRYGLNPEETTIAEICKQKDYATACYGKWHVGDQPRYLPTRQGFDEYYGLPYSNDMWPYHPNVRHLPMEQRLKRWPALPMVEGERIVDDFITPEEQTQLTTEYTRRAVDFIRRNRQRPFLVYLPHSMVHVPLYVSEKFAGKSGAGLFGDVVMEIDWSVGQILDTLRQLDLADNTLVIFTSDNGPWLSYGTHAGSAGPLREGKATTFEGGMRVPTIFWWPGKVPADSTCSQLASTIDILPTMAHLIDAELPDHKIDGKDIRPLIFDEPGAESPHEAYPMYFAGQLRAIRDNRFKLVFPHTYRTLNGRPGGTDGLPVKYDQAKAPLALYDLQSDLGETRDVKDRFPQVARRLQATAEMYRKTLGDKGRSGSEMRPAARPQKGDRTLIP